MNTRTDNHRVSQIVPADYDYVLSYALPSSLDGWPVPAVNVDQVVSLRASGARFAEHGGLGSCTVCGTGHTYGDLWRHARTGEYIFVGHICADKYGLIADRQGWERELEGVRMRSAREHEVAMKQERFDHFAAQHDGLAADLQVDHYIIADIAGKLREYGSISDKQIALVRKLAEEKRNPAAEEATVPAPVEEGRQTVTGRIVSVKTRTDDWGTSVKMTVKVATDDGVWLTWGTLPTSLAEELQHKQIADRKAYREALEHDDTLPSVLKDATLKGSLVRFDAKLKVGRDAHFTMFSRPTKASVIEWAVEA